MTGDTDTTASEERLSTHDDEPRSPPPGTSGEQRRIEVDEHADDDRLVGFDFPPGGTRARGSEPAPGAMVVRSNAAAVRRCAGEARAAAAVRRLRGRVE